MSMINPLRDGRHYDALKTQDDIAFYLTYAQQAAGPVLEIGCGTGRVTIPLAAHGVDITGLDVSSSMLAEAKRKAQQQSLEIRWVQADGRNFELGQHYALILMPFNILQFFHEAESLRQVFGCVKRHLLPGGRLIFDVFNPQVAFLAEDPQRRYERARYDDPEGSGEVVIEETHEYIAARQIVRSTRYYHVGSERNKWTGTLELRCFFPCELDLLLEHHGFHREEKLGNFDGSPFSDAAPKQIVICSPVP
jgi:SAM-dependent methyltransferase